MTVLTPSLTGIVRLLQAMPGSASNGSPGRPVRRRAAPLDAAEHAQLLALLGKLATFHGLADGVHPGYRDA